MHDKEPIRNPILIIVQNTASPDDQLAIGWGTSPFGGVEQTIVTESTPPVNVSFIEAPTRTEGALLGVSIPPRSWRAIWVRRLVSFNAAEHPQNGGIIRLLSDNVVDEVIDEEQIPKPDEDSSFSAVGEFDDSFTMAEIYKRIRGRNSNMHVSTGNMSAATATASAGNATATAGGGVAVATAGGVTAVAGTGVINRTRMSFGQDDADTISKENYWKNQGGISNKYSSYQFQNVHFLFMDTASGKKFWDSASPQFAFVKKDLTDAVANPANDWIFVVTNRVMYASATTTEPKFILKELRDLYHPIFMEKGVHVVLQGDICNYQRSFPLAFNTANSDVPTLINAVQNPDYTIPIGQTTINDATTKKVGSIFLVDGTGGRQHHNIIGPSFFTAARNATDWGYMEFFLRNTDEFRKITGVFYKMKAKKVKTGNKKETTEFDADRIDDKFVITKEIVTG